MKYSLDERLKLFPLLMYGAQWLLISIPLVVILSAIVAQVSGYSAAGQAFYARKLFGLMGIGMIVQVLWGHRTPLVLGPASVLLIGVLAASASGAPAIYTAVMIGGAALCLLSFTGLLSKVTFLFTPRIVVVILALIAFTLAPVILNLIFDNRAYPLFSLAFGVSAALAMVLANRVLKGVWKATVVLWALLGGSLIYYGVTGFPGPVAAVTPAHEVSFLVGSPVFEPGVILSFLFCYIALLVNELGSVQSVGALVGADRVGERSNRAVGVTGVLNVAAGALGVIGPVDYSLSPGVIAATGCASRFALIPAGIGLLLCAFLPGVALFLTAIPPVVMGAVMLYLMASQLSASFQMLGGGRVATDFGSGVTVGLPLMVALIFSFAPHEAMQQIPALIRPVAGNGFVMGVITVLLLEHGIFRTTGRKG